MNKDKTFIEFCNEADKIMNTKKETLLFWQLASKLNKYKSLKKRQKELLNINVERINKAVTFGKIECIKL